MLHLNATAASVAPQTRLGAWSYRRQYRAARDWAEALHLACAEAERNVPGSHITVTPWRVTPTGRLTVTVRIVRHVLGVCRCSEEDFDNA